MFKRKVGAAVMAARRAGSTHAFDTMNHFPQPADDDLKKAMLGR